MTAPRRSPRLAFGGLAMTCVFFLLIPPAFSRETPRLVAAKVPTLKTLPSKCIGKDCFEWTADVGGKTVPLRGAGLFRYLRADLYSAALYVPEEIKTTDILADVPKALLFVCHHDIKKEDILRVSDKNLRGNPTVDYKKIQRRLEKLNAFYKTVKDGDYYRILYSPGHGTVVEYNGRERILILGEDFARAYFGMWISKYSINQKFRKELLDLK